MTTRNRTPGRTPTRESAPAPGRRRGLRWAVCAILAPALWTMGSVPAALPAPVVLSVPAALSVPSAPAQGDPGPEPVIPAPPPEPAQIAAQPQDPGPPPLYPPELSGGPGLVPPGMSGPGGTTPLPGQGGTGLSSPARALVAPIEQPQPDAPEPGLSPYTVPGSGLTPFALPVSPATALSACPHDVAPGEILPLVIWSMSPDVGSR